MRFQKLEKFAEGFVAVLVAALVILTHLCWLVPIFGLHLPVFFILGLMLLFSYIFDVHGLRTRSPQKVTLVSGLLTINLDEARRKNELVVWDLDHPVGLLLLSSAFIGFILFIAPISASTESLLHIMLFSMQVLALVIGLGIIALALWVWKKRYTPLFLMEVKTGK